MTLNCERPEVWIFWRCACCAVWVNNGTNGDRVPAVYFYPGKRQLHVIDGHGAVDGGNDECVIEDELQPGIMFT
jgi:hypothetical protein